MSLLTIGAVSDTHIPKRARSFPDELLEGLKGVDIIIHAGDLLKDYVIYELQEIAPVFAVAGNNDDEYIRDMLGYKKIINAGSCKIGITHGDGTGSTTLKRAMAVFKDDGVDCVVFGHSHIPYNERIDGVLYFNPGSPTDRRRQQHFSYGIIRVDGNMISGEIKYF